MQVRFRSVVAIVAGISLGLGLACGNRDPIRAPTVDTTPPGRVTNLMAGLPSPTSMSLIWTAPGDDENVGTVSGYDLRYAASPITEAAFSSATPATLLLTPQPGGNGEGTTVTGLTRGTTYYFALKARDEAENWSALSNSPGMSTIGGPTTDTAPPGRVSDLNATSPGPNSILLSWTATGDDGASGNAFLYDIRYGSEPIVDEDTWDAAAQASREPSPPGPSGTRQEFRLTNLGQDTRYHFAIRVGDESGNLSVLSNSVTEKTTGADAVNPAPISDLQAAPVSVNQVQVAWTATGDDDKAGRASLYEIRYSTSSLNEGSWSQASIVPDPPTPREAGTPNEIAIIRGLTPGTTYYIGVKARDERSTGWSALSNVASATPTEPLAPDFTLRDRSGVIHTLSQYRGTNAVLLEFWTTWSSPCSRAFEKLKDYHERYASSGLKILAISEDGEATAYKIDGYISSHALPFPVLHDAESTVGPAFSVRNYPTTVLIDTQGRVVGTWVGFQEGEDRSPEIEAVLPDCRPPAAIQDLSVDPAQTSSTSVMLSWRAPSVPEGTGAQHYDIRYSTSEITAQNWDRATPVLLPPDPQGAGLTEIFTVSPLQPEADYWFAIKSSTLCQSGLSNVVHEKTDPPFGQGWNAFPIPLDPVAGQSKVQVVSFCKMGDDLIVGGSFQVPGSTARGIARWDGQAWHAVFDAAEGVAALGVFQGKLIASTHGEIVSWDGIRKTTIGTIAQSEVVYGFEEYGGELIAFGSFTSINFSTRSNVARWNGSTWQSLGTGVPGMVSGAAVYEGNLVVPWELKVRAWDGTAWSALGDRVGLYGVSWIAASGTELVAASMFGMPNEVYSVVRWSGTEWTPLGAAFQGLCWSISVRNGSILVCGGDSVTDQARMSRWTGTEWVSVGTATAEGGNAVFWPTIEYGPGVVVGGSFTTLENGAPVRSLAVWVP